MAVKLESFKGRLRLRWSHQGVRYSLSLHLDDTALARTIAQGRASLIDADLVTGNFDRTLAKYKSEIPSVPGTKITAVDLFQRFLEYKVRSFTGRTDVKYKALLGKIQTNLSGESAAVSHELASNFKSQLSPQSPVTLKGNLSILHSCWEWGIRQSFVSENPWGELKRVKVPPKQKPKPFTANEIKAIVKGFQDSPYYRHYADFVEFLFSTGCRTGEAIGLRWSHLSDDCDKVWIGESVSRGVRKATKTNRSREFCLPQKLQALLQERRPANCQPDGLVFPAPEGGAIDDHNFRNRAWKTVLKAAGVSYRKPYNTRHTFISHALAKGGNPLTIAQMAGHDPEVLFSNYAADIEGGLQLPEILQL
jgi:integrase